MEAEAAEVTCPEVQAITRWPRSDPGQLLRGGSTAVPDRMTARRQVIGRISMSKTLEIRLCFVIMMVLPCVVHALFMVRYLILDLSSLSVLSMNLDSLVYPPSSCIISKYWILNYVFLYPGSVSSHTTGGSVGGVGVCHQECLTVTLVVEGRGYGIVFRPPPHPSDPDTSLPVIAAIDPGGPADK